MSGTTENLSSRAGDHLCERVIGVLTCYPELRKEFERMGDAGDLAAFRHHLKYQINECLLDDVLGVEEL